MSAADPAPNSDAHLTSPSMLRRMQEQDAEAWRRFVDLYGPLVFSWLRRTGLPGNDVLVPGAGDDVVGGGAGFDVLRNVAVSTTDANFDSRFAGNVVITLTNNSMLAKTVTGTNLHEQLMADVESIDLTTLGGGAVVDVSNFTKPLSFDGGADSDRVISRGQSGILLTNTGLCRSSGGAALPEIVLVGVERADAKPQPRESPILSIDEDKFIRVEQDPAGAPRPWPPRCVWMSASRRTEARPAVLLDVRPVRRGPRRWPCSSSGSPGGAGRWLRGYGRW